MVCLYERIYSGTVGVRRFVKYDGEYDFIINIVSVSDSARHAL